MIIDINVKNKIATLVNPDIYGVCHNGDYIVHFNFDSEWDEFTTKTMRVNYGGNSSSVIFSGNDCELPPITHTGSVEIGVFAGDLHTTTPATMPFIKSVLSAGGPEPDPVPSVYAQLIKMLDNLSAGTAITKDGTVVSPNADFAEVAEWADGNPDNEDRTGYFVCANVPVDGIDMRKATSIDDVKGVSILAPAFAGNYSKDKLDSNGNLLPKYSYVAILGFVPVIDNGTCTVGGRCMPDDNGCAIPSSNSMGYQVVNRIDENRVLIIIEPNGDMVQRIKTKINKLQEDVDDLAPDQTYNPKSPNAQSGLAVAEAVESAVGGNFELIETIEITEEGLAEITRNSEPSGNPYNFKDVYITFKWYNGSESGKWVKIRVKVDGKTTDAFRVVSAAKLAGSWIKTVYQNGHRIFMLSDATTNYGYGAYYTQIPEATIMSDKPIEAVTILHQTAFTAGTVIEIWGVRA